MAQENPIAGFPPEGKIVEVDTSGGILRGSHAHGRWRDENGNPISVKGWRYIRAAEPEGDAPAKRGRTFRRKPS